MVFENISTDQLIKIFIIKSSKNGQCLLEYLYFYLIIILMINNGETGDDDSDSVQ